MQGGGRREREVNRGGIRQQLGAGIESSRSSDIYIFWLCDLEEVTELV
jgi:hypothetical protein